MVDVNPSKADARAFILFIQAADAVRKYADARLYQAGLSTIRLIVLQVLAANGGTMTPTAIAYWTLRERHNITTLIGRLQKDRLVRVEPSSADRRSVQVVLTDEGWQLLKQATPVAIEIVRQVMSSLNDDSIAELEKSLRVLRESAYNGLQQVGQHP